MRRCNNYKARSNFSLNLVAIFLLTSKAVGPNSKLGLKAPSPVKISLYKLMTNANSANAAKKY